MLARGGVGTYLVLFILLSRSVCVVRGGKLVLDVVAGERKSGEKTRVLINGYVTAPGRVYNKVLSPCSPCFSDGGKDRGALCGTKIFVFEFDHFLHCWPVYPAA